jgi:hypothetical protein
MRPNQTDPDLKTTMKGRPDPRSPEPTDARAQRAWDGPRGDGDGPALRERMARAGSSIERSEIAGGGDGFAGGAGVSPVVGSEVGSIDGVPDGDATDRRWRDIKSRFVDDPAGAIAAAEECVHQVVDRRVRALQDEVTALCARERDEDESSTETLRNRLIRYQAYCERLAGRPD